MVRTTEVAYGPAQRHDRDAPEPRSVDPKGEQGLPLARRRLQHDDPRGCHFLGLRALRPRPVPRPAHEGAACSRPGEQLVPDPGPEI